MQNILRAPSLWRSWPGAVKLQFHHNKLQEQMAGRTSLSVAELARGTKAPLTSARCGDDHPPASRAAVASVSTRVSSRAGLHCG